MNWLDIVLLLLILIPAFTGLKTGLVKTLVSLAGVIIGIILAGRFQSALGDKLTFIPSTGAADIVAFAIILIAVMVISLIVGSLASAAISAIPMMGLVNHLGGAVIGVVMGAFFCGAVLAAVVKFFGNTSVVTSSAIAGFLLNNFPLVLSLLPAQFNSVRDFFK
jgi:membrane protein required for colicin V production